jgi:rhamnose utilization protein RhaD (predicted bifunctional aldolase and dehydrogenase)
MTRPAERSHLLETLVQLSRRIGENHRLVQPGGGNTSIKTDGVL